MEKTYDIVFQIIVDRFGVEAEKVNENLSFCEDLGADSLDIVEMVMEIEDTFQIQIPDQEVEKVKTVQDIVKAIQEK